MLLLCSQFPNADNQVISIMKYSPKIQDNGKHITCKAENPAIKDFVIEDKWTLNIQCKSSSIFWSIALHTISVVLCSSSNIDSTAATFPYNVSCKRRNINAGFAFFCFLFSAYRRFSSGNVENGS